MNDLSPIYKLRSGVLKNEENLSVEIRFGLVYEIEGEYQLEIFFEKNLDLENLYDRDMDAFTNGKLKLESVTQDGNSLVAYHLVMRSLPFAKSKCVFYCWSHLYIEEPLDEIDIKANESDTIPDLLYYLKIEGLKMRFSDNTHTSISRRGEQLSNRGLGLPIWDHSYVTITHAKVSYHCEFSLDNDTKTIIVRFKKPYAQYVWLPFEIYREFKDDFESLLSFINGAKVKVRAEYTGQYVKGPTTFADVHKSLTSKKASFGAHKKYLFSFPTIMNRRYNQYIPLQNGGNRQENIVSNVLTNHFDSYRECNKLLDLNKIVFYLCNAEQSMSIDERMFTQTIVMERLSHSYLQTLDTEKEQILDDNDCKNVKSELLEVLMKNEVLFGEKFMSVKSRVLDFNYIKRGRTDEKMRTLIQGIGMELTDEIEYIVGVVRNSTIHQGNIAPDGEAYKNYILLDKLIRDIILVLIKYKGPYLDVERQFNV